ncbi:MAG: leucine--tRNA ligase [Armatimonadetes bacterium]|nr:leucine--tRNA ligase [Armatimonadota bacterium]
MPERYEPKTFEAKWKQRWDEAGLFLTQEDSDRPKFYGLDFFPYPSGAGLSVGHARNYVPTDVICRAKVMQGYNVLHPMGFDAFGLPAENEAIAKKTHPGPMVKSYGANYKRQMDLIGISYDWSRCVYSSDPEYYKWTQWIFELLYKKGLAYRKLASVNWCPKDATVLADEEVEGGLCWRCGTAVEKKWIPQWFFKITAYADRLLSDLDELNWPDGIKEMQRNWIGRSEGVEFEMRIAPSLVLRSETEEGVGGGDNGSALSDPSDQSDASAESDLQVISKERHLSFRVFTTRIDTIFGMTFCVLSPEHPILENLMPLVDEEHRKAVKAYQDQAKRLSDTDRQAVNREKTGVFTGAYAVNPANGEKVPIWIADYVLASYGTGAIMAVPGHDERDFEFARKFGLGVVPVIAPVGQVGQDGQAPRTTQDVFSGKDGILINSGEYDGMTVKEAQESLGQWMEGLGIGERKVTYRLRDWLISRQRYWGCPIPVIYDKEGHEMLATEGQLPVELPDVENYEPSGDGSSPLNRIEEFVNATTPDGSLGRRETDTMGGFACSSWYFLRFCDPSNPNKPWDFEKAKYWMPVDCYVGGAEHAVMHLLYARFWTKVLYDEGLVSVKEPFQRLMNQGQVLALTPYRKPREGETLEVGADGILVSFEEAKGIPKDQLMWRWARMSKSKGNVVTPDEMVDQYGADALRVHLLFVAPFDGEVQWSSDGVGSMAKFLNRVFKAVTELSGSFDSDWRTKIQTLWSDQSDKSDLSDGARNLRRATHQAIKKCTEDIDRFAFNTYIAALMTYLNSIADAQRAGANAPGWRLAASEALETLILLLAPAAPFSADELWESLGLRGFTHQQAWPVFDPEIAAEDVWPIAVQVNGKLRDTVMVPAGSSNQELEAAAKASAKVQVHLEGKEVKKVIVVPGKLVNIVAV